ncbi:MAG: nucleotide sugar dehydrogenase, partial [Verrucomicrobiota bacterium]
MSTSTKISKVAVVGLGYVGLPLTLRFGAVLTTIGFDESAARVDELRGGDDRSGSVDKQMLSESAVTLSSEATCLNDADVIIITVPTPVDEAHQPDLRAIRKATETVAQQMKRGVTVVYESTVYPGLTEEVCVPLLEEGSGMHWKLDFNVGYSPERVNPGDQKRTVEQIVKVVAGDTPETLERLSSLYEKIITAGVYRAPSIRVAEAAKVIENTQRDLNIALMNELSVLFHKLGLDTQEVLAAAETKWNFLKFEPGLVGGHCIGVDP